MNEKGDIITTKKIDFIPLLLIVVFQLLEAVLSVLIAPYTQDIEFRYSLVWFISKLIPLIIGIIIYRKRFIEEGKKTFKNIFKFLMYVLVSYFVFYLFQLAASYYQTFMDKLFEIGESTNQNTIIDYFEASNTTINYVLLFLVVVILAPLLEELLFRELIFSAFKGTKQIIPIILSAVLFGILHLSSFSLIELAYFPLYFIPGFAFALIYHYSNHNIYTNFLVHSVSNLISFIVIMASLGM